MSPEARKLRANGGHVKEREPATARANGWSSGQPLTLRT